MFVKLIYSHEHTAYNNLAPPTLSTAGLEQFCHAPLDLTPPINSNNSDHSTLTPLNSALTPPIQPAAL